LRRNKIGSICNSLYFIKAVIQFAQGNSFAPNINEVRATSL
jgi:hypothetical protein